METSRAEGLLKGTLIPHEKSNIVSVKQVSPQTRQITLENGKKMFVSKDRVKALVEHQLMAKAKASHVPVLSPGQEFANLYAQRRAKAAR